MAQPDAKTMKDLVRQGKAMPGPGQGRPGRFNIEKQSDLENAIKAVGRVQPPTDEARAKVRRFILKRATEMNLQHMIPATWNADGTLK
jgi:hypothetical protein